MSSDIEKMFLQYGYDQEDICYIIPKSIVVTERYSDENGNEVSALPVNCKVIIEGYNNKISLLNVIVNESLTIICQNNANLLIKDNTVFERKSVILYRGYIWGKQNKANNSY